MSSSEDQPPVIAADPAALAAMMDDEGENGEEQAIHFTMPDDGDADDAQVASTSGAPLAEADDVNDSDDASDDDGDDAPGVTAAADDGAVRDRTTTLSKAEAKATLSKKEYKRWKKQLKKDKKRKDKDKKRKASERAGAEERKSKSAGKKSSSTDPKKQKKPTGRKGRAKKYRPEGESDDDEAMHDGDYAPSSDDGGSGDEAQPSTSRKRSAGNKTKKQPQRTADGQPDYDAMYDFGDGAQPRTLRDQLANAPGADASKKMSRAVKMAKERVECEQLVKRMKEASEADAAALRDPSRGAPLNRLALIPMVRNVAVRPYLHEKLVECGILRQLCGWLCSGKVLAPLDLRTTALAALSSFAMEGVEGGRSVPRRIKRKDGEIIEEDVDVWEGITRDDLKNTNLGFAVNLLRQSREESQENRAVAAYLLQRMSRAFSGTTDKADEYDLSAVKKWPSQGDPTVLAPYEPIKTASEMFVERRSQVDPLDPQSYLRQPPMKFSPVYVTGIFTYGDKKRRQAGAEDDEDDVAAA